MFQAAAVAAGGPGDGFFSTMRLTAPIVASAVLLVRFLTAVPLELMALARSAPIAW